MNIYGVIPIRKDTMPYIVRRLSKGMPRINGYILSIAIGVMVLAALQLGHIGLERA